MEVEIRAKNKEQLFNMLYVGYAIDMMDKVNIVNQMGIKVPMRDKRKQKI